MAKKKSRHHEDADNALEVRAAHALMQLLGKIWMKRQATLAETYVACFTEARDDLGQWRAYGGSADRYCIGVDTRAMSERGRYSFAPVIYSREQQEKLIDDYLAATLTFV